LQVYVSEVSSSKLRGIFTSLTEVSISVGVLLIYTIASFEGFLYYNHALIMAGIAALFELY